MSARHVVFSILISSLPLFAQSSYNSVTVTASGANAKADQAVFSISLFSGPDRSFEDVVGVLGGTGVTATNFNYLYSDTFAAPTDGDSQLRWGFQLVVPLAKMKDTAAILKKTGLSLSFEVQSTSSAQAQSCDFAALVGNARAQAQKIAAAGGFRAGPVLSVTAGSGCSVLAKFAFGATLAQTEPNSVTVTASRTQSIVPDQVVFDLNVTTGAGRGAG